MARDVAYHERNTLIISIFRLATCPPLKLLVYYTLSPCKITSSAHVNSITPSIFVPEPELLASSLPVLTHNPQAFSLSTFPLQIQWSPEYSPAPPPSMVSHGWANRWRSWTPSLSQPRGRSEPSATAETSFGEGSSGQPYSSRHRRQLSARFSSQPSPPRRRRPRAVIPPGEVRSSSWTGDPIHSGSEMCLLFQPFILPVFYAGMLRLLRSGSYRSIRHLWPGSFSSCGKSPVWVTEKAIYLPTTSYWNYWFVLVYAGIFLMWSSTYWTRRSTITFLILSTYFNAP